MNAIEQFLDKLDKVRKSGNQWSACCPAHKDRTPSLSISLGEDSRILIKCHRGCSAEDIVQAMGLRLADLMPKRGSKSSAKKPKSPAGRVFNSAEAAIRDLERKFGPSSRHWEYQSSDGEVVAVVVRWDRDKGKKEFRPVSRHRDGWRTGAMSPPRPLYRLPELGNANIVLVTEGEKAADEARSLGFVATTSARADFNFM